MRIATHKRKPFASTPCQYRSSLHGQCPEHQGTRSEYTSAVNEEWWSEYNPETLTVRAYQFLQKTRKNQLMNMSGHK